MRLSSASTPLAAEKEPARASPHELWKDVNEEWIHFWARNLQSLATCASVVPSLPAPFLRAFQPLAHGAARDPVRRAR